MFVCFGHLRKSYHRNSIRCRNGALKRCWQTNIAGKIGLHIRPRLTPVSHRNIFCFAYPSATPSGRLFLVWMLDVNKTWWERLKPCKSDDDAVIATRVRFQISCVENQCHVTTKDMHSTVSLGYFMFFLILSVWAISLISMLTSKLYHGVFIFWMPTFV